MSKEMFAAQSAPSDLTIKNWNKDTQYDEVRVTSETGGEKLVGAGLVAIGSAGALFSAGFVATVWVMYA